MKREIIAAAALLALLCACSPQHSEPSVSSDMPGMKPPPEVSAALDVPGAEPSPEITETPWSMRITRRSHDAEGEPDGWIMECYDDAQRLISRTEHVGLDGSEFVKRYVYDDSGVLIETYEHDWLLKEYEYDERGNLVTEKTYYEDGAVNMLHEYSYDDADRLLFEQLSGGDGEVYYSTEYAYDENGRLAFEYDGDGAYTAYIRDEADSITAELYYDASGNETSRTEYIRDSDGRVVSEKSYSGGALFLWYETEYDENGNKISFKRLNMQGDVQDMVLFEYDDEGRLLGNTRFDAEGNLVSFTEYKYEYA